MASPNDHHRQRSLPITTRPIASQDKVHRDSVRQSRNSSDCAPTLANGCCRSAFPLSRQPGHGSHWFHRLALDNSRRPWIRPVDL